MDKLFTVTAYGEHGETWRCNINPRYIVRTLQAGERNGKPVHAVYQQGFPTIYVAEEDLEQMVAARSTEP